MAWALAALLCILLVELAVRLPFGATLARLAASGGTAARIVGSSRISDHWKEKAMAAHARRTFLASLRLAALLAVVLGCAAAVVLGFEQVAPGFGALLFGWSGLVVSATVATLYAWVRARATRPSAYGLADRVLHRLALGVRPVAEFGFDIDRKAAGVVPAASDDGRHVFVSGLARAGTTALMRRLHASGGFRSLTYRDMPFVLAPNTWGKALAGKAAGEARERAHGDGILVDADSPEALDEVYWRTFDRKGYIFDDHLGPHDPDDATVAGYVGYVRAILASQPGAKRYLSKNNNGVLRLPAIRRAFPNATILVPFREPVAHAASLMRQHRRFVDMQGEDPFVRNYMTWLGHHEFGRDRRPFRFDADGAARLSPRDPAGIDHWLEIWLQTYAWVDRTAPADAVFVSYERLCRDPAVWRRLAAMIGVDPAAGEPFVVSDRATDVTPDAGLAAGAAALHARLVARSRASPGPAAAAA